MKKAICTLTDWSILSDSEYEFLKSCYDDNRLKIFKIYNIDFYQDTVVVYSDDCWQMTMYKRTFNKAFKII